jgi:Tfp pilus assembly protein PilZ
MHKDIERRQSERIPHRSTILHNTNPPDFFYSGVMYNFSAGGLYFESNEDLLQGDEVSISIKEPPALFSKKSDQYFDVKIMWCRDLQRSSYQVGYGAKLI